MDQPMSGGQNDIRVVVATIDGLKLLFIDLMRIMSISSLLFIVSSATISFCLFNLIQVTTESADMTQLIRQRGNEMMICLFQLSVTYYCFDEPIKLGSRRTRI